MYLTSRQPPCAFRRARGGAGAAAQRKRAARLPRRRPASLRPRPARPCPAPASPRPRRRRPREPCRDAPHCLRGGCSPRAPAARAQSAAARTPAPASRPRRPLWTPARPVRSDAPRQPRAPARRLAAERRRPARARDPARGGARPRGCVGPVRPGPAGPWTGQCPVAGEGFSPGGVPRPALVALDTGHRPPVPLPARAYSAARPCQPAILALPAPGRCPAPPPSSGTLPAPHFPGSLCVTFGEPDASVCPRTPPPRPRASGAALYRGWTVRLGTGLLASAVLSG